MALGKGQNYIEVGFVESGGPEKGVAIGMLDDRSRVQSLADRGPRSPRLRVRHARRPSSCRAARGGPRVECGRGVRLRRVVFDGAAVTSMIWRP